VETSILADDILQHCCPFQVETSSVLSGRRELSQFCHLEQVKVKNHTVIRADLMCLSVRVSTNLKSKYNTYDWGIDSVENGAAPLPCSYTAGPGSNPVQKEI